MNFLFLMVLIIFPGLTYALDNTLTTETELQVNVSKSAGYEIGRKVNQAVEFLKRGDREKALITANDVLNGFGVGLHIDRIEDA